ncbi:MAG: hypothetical protein NXI23_12410 [Bacteroidetes bacterium]|jgi:membrane protein DedA with SNARE-associated domain|nr:hypothetical protein [Bacteroidota bacterium]MDF1866021.1 hypothetical protein [Saprospiraceae bacterium]
MKAKQILGAILLVALLASLGYKLNAAFSRFGDPMLSIFIIFLVVLFFVFVIRFILSR